MSAFTAFRIASLALVLLPLLSQAQLGTPVALGLEVPAPRPPHEGHFLTGAYVSGTYAPLLAPGTAGYAVQPYLRYVLGRPGHYRPYLQYALAPYAVYYGGSAAPLSESGGAVPAPAFSPLAMRSATGYPGLGSYGGLGSFSVGIPLQVGRGTAVLNLGGSLLESAFMNSLGPLR